jgi:hypothetical protein
MLLSITIKRLSAKSESLENGSAISVFPEDGVLDLVRIPFMERCTRYNFMW